MKGKGSDRRCKGAKTVMHRSCKCSAFSRDNYVVLYITGVIVTINISFIFLSSFCDKGKNSI